jgi:hypothetical protein
MAPWNGQLLVPGHLTINTILHIAWRRKSSARFVRQKRYTTGGIFSLVFV